MHNNDLNTAARQLRPMATEMLQEVASIEKTAFTHPWTLGKFTDALRSGYQCQALIENDTLLGYFVAMQILDEVHLLNITVAPPYQGQGLALQLLQGLCSWSKETALAQSLWLEVRESNARARKIYTSYGFTQVGARKRYYPVESGERETAILMKMSLWP